MRQADTTDGAGETSAWTRIAARSPRPMWIVALADCFTKPGRYKRRLLAKLAAQEKRHAA